MATSFISVNSGNDAIARQVQQIIDWIIGASGGDIPAYMTRLDSASLPALTLRNRNAAGIPLCIYAADGTTKLFEVQPTRPTVTGSRGGNAALASALTALASLDLVTDSSTA